MTRVLTSLALIPVVLYLILFAPGWLFFSVVVLIACLCFHEFSGIARGYDLGGLGPFGYVAGVLVLLEPQQTLLLLVFTAMLALTLELRAADLGKVLPETAVLVLGVVYIFGSWKFAVLLRAANAHWLVYALALNWVGDIAAYYVGRSMGRHKLAPRVSPKKSWEGAAASLAASVVFGGFYLGRFLPAIPLAQSLALSAAANVAGQFGDLSESALKRGAGVKDSSSLLPGHGGWLDRVDSTLFALPIVYLFAQHAG
jgi:phosphatidate cytidylyltransferase